jgi:hypothetical protein
VVDTVLVPAKPAALRLTIMLYRHGRPQVDAHGNRRCYLRGNLAQLGRTAGISRRALVDAIADLVEIGFLTAHGRTHQQAPTGISAPYDDPQAGAKFAPTSEATATPHGGDRRSPGAPLNRHETTTTTRAPARAKIALALQELGVTDPAFLIDTHGEERCDRALWATDQANRRNTLKNPAGLLVLMLRRKSDLAPRPPAATTWTAPTADEIRAVRERTARLEHYITAHGCMCGFDGTNPCGEHAFDARERASNK